MKEDSDWQHWVQYQPETWRDGWSLTLDQLDASREPTFAPDPQHPDIRDRSQLLELLGKINYRILSGKKVYVEVGGVVYKALYGGYWRSVFTGIEHYLLKCQRISGSVWSEDIDSSPINLPIVYSHHGWTAKGHSLSYLLSRDLDLPHRSI